VHNEPSLVLPLWVWDREKHRPHCVCETASELAGEVEQTDSISLGYILVDGSGCRYVVETNERLTITRFERLDAFPLDASLELLHLMQSVHPSGSVGPAEGPTFRVWRFLRRLRGARPR